MFYQMLPTLSGIDIYTYWEPQRWRTEHRMDHFPRAASELNVSFAPESPAEGVAIGSSADHCYDQR